MLSVHLQKRTFSVQDIVLRLVALLADYIIVIIGDHTAAQIWLISSSASIDIHLVFFLKVGRANLPVAFQLLRFCIVCGVAA